MIDESKLVKFNISCLIDFWKLLQFLLFRKQKKFFFTYLQCSALASNN